MEKPNLQDLRHEYNLTELNTTEKALSQRLFTYVSGVVCDTLFELYKYISLLWLLNRGIITLKKT